MGLLIFHQLRQSKVKSILIKIPDKADIIENVDSTSSHLGSFPFHEFLVLCPLIVDPRTKPTENIRKIVVINMFNVESKQGDADIPHLLWIVIVHFWDITVTVLRLVFFHFIHSFHPTFFISVKTCPTATCHVCTIAFFPQ